MGQRMPLFVDEAPEYEARGAVMFVRWPGLEIVMPISVCVAALGRCRCELSAWESKRAEIIPMRADHAASS
jgi:hypothetical protein